MNSQEFADKLATGVYSIEFTKLDGALRKMIATRNGMYIPVDKTPETSRPITEGKAVPVFDLDVCGWRSVIPGSITAIEVHNGWGVSSNV